MPLISGFGELAGLPWEHINDKIEETEKWAVLICRILLAGKNGGPASVEAWFAGGERIGYDPEAAAIVASAPLKVFLRCEGDLAHAVSFLSGYPDGSFGWAKVLPYLPNATAMPKLFVEYVGIGDSDKSKDYA